VIFVGHSGKFGRQGLGWWNGQSSDINEAQLWTRKSPKVTTGQKDNVGSAERQRGSIRVSLKCQGILNFRFLEERGHSASFLELNELRSTKLIGQVRVSTVAIAAKGCYLKRLTRSIGCRIVLKDADNNLWGKRPIVWTGDIEGSSNSDLSIKVRNATSNSLNPVAILDLSSRWGTSIQITARISSWKVSLANGFFGTSACVGIATSASLKVR